MAHRREKDNNGIEFSDMFSTDRYFYDEKGWHYYARGFRDGDAFIMGPFSSKEEAIKDCEDRFIKPNHL